MLLTWNNWRLYVHKSLIKRKHFFQWSFCENSIDFSFVYFCAKFIESISNSRVCYLWNRQTFTLNVGNLIWIFPFCNKKIHNSHEYELYVESPEMWLIAHSPINLDWNLIIKRGKLWNLSLNLNQLASEKWKANKIFSSFSFSLALFHHLLAKV